MGFKIMITKREKSSENCFYIVQLADLFRFNEQNLYFFTFVTDPTLLNRYMKSSDAKASKCHLKFSSRMIIFTNLVYLSSVISLKWQ